MAEMPEPEALLEHRAFLRAIAKGLLKDDAAAEDVAQETLLAAMERPPQGRNLRGWLGAVARNLSLMARRGERRRENRERQAARPEAVAPATEALALIELQRKVVDAVRTLDEPYRTAIVLHYFHDLPVRELAARLRVPKETARTRLRRGLGTLRARLDRDYGGNRSWAPLLVVLAADPRKVSVAGVALMTAKTKIAILAAACVLLTFLTVKWGGLGGTETPRAEASRPAVPEAAPEAPSLSLPEPVDFALVDRDRDLHGIVVDKSLNPIGGADLRAVFYPHRRVFTYHPEYDTGTDGPRTKSASDGTFRLPLEPGQEVWLRCSAAGYAALELAHLQAGERTRVQLTEPAELVLRVKDEAGAPIAGADVTVRSSEEVEIRRAARTDAQGVARIGDLPAGVLVYASAMHAACGRTLMRYGLGVPAEAEFVLPAGRWHSGRVTDAATGAPIPGARVGMSWMFEPATRADEQGCYRLNGWYGEQYAQEILAIADGYVMAGTALGVATEYDFALERGIEVTGRLLDGEGKPVDQASVAALGGLVSLHGNAGTPLSRAHGASDDKGEFRLAPLRASTLHTLVVTAHGHGRYLLDFDTEAGATALGDVALPASFCVAGAVLDSMGAPVPRARVTLDGRNRDSRSSRQSSDLFDGRAESRWTDDLGRFRFPDLGPGSYRVYTNRRGGSSLSRTVLVKDADILDVKLQAPDERPFVVWVVDDAGEPVPEADIRVEHGAGNSFEMTDKRGLAELKVSGRIKTVHSPSASGYGEAKPIADLPEDAAEARFVLPRWEEILGTVVDEAGAPVAEAIVEVRWGPGEPRKIRTGAHGKFHVTVPPGTVADLRVTGKYVPGPGGGLMEAGGLVGEVLGVAAGSRDVVVRTTVPRRDATLRVRVLTPDGKPLQGARVTYQPQPLENRVMVETDADGRALLTQLPAAEITVSAFFDSAKLGFVFPLWLKLTPTGQEVELKCREAARLKGTVVDPKGAPMFALVFATHEGQMFSGFADKEGRFEMIVPADAETLDLQASHKSPDGLQLYGFVKHRIADGEARIVVKPPD